MNKTLRTKSSNNRIVVLLMIIGLFALFMSGCGQTAEPAKNTTNIAPNTNINSANTATNNAATNTATNSEAAKANTNTGASNTSPMAPGHAADSCDAPADNEVIVYEHVFSQDGGGKCVKLKPGEYKNAAEMGFPDNNMSSIKVGVYVRATVCDGENFAAPCEDFDKTDDDLTNNPTIKNDTVSSIKVVEVKANQAAESKPEAVEAFKNNLVGEWIRETTIMKFTENTAEQRNASEAKPWSTRPIKFVDGKTIEFGGFVDGKPFTRKQIMTFEDNGNTLVWYGPESGKSISFKRVNPK